MCYNCILNKHTGPLEKNKVCIHGLSDNISRDQLELHLEHSVDCEVTDIQYGLDPTVALVTFTTKIGNISSNISFRKDFPLIISITQSKSVLTL